MNYEEKYKEALERAKKFEGKYGGDYAGYIFPELAESEDERIRKAIIHYILYETKGAISEDTEHTWVKWLEKQKENPKSADSIPSDCVSDAKCEDRWHKVGDSLPDNPREVLCKDEAGNYFIGRYYVGEGWEISNYDDEDKPHHLNPPVSKWIDFPLEKQKDLTTENIYKHSRERMSFWDGQQKEQKPEWSEEDADILNCCISSIEEAKENRYAYKETDGDTSYDREIAWLKSLRPHWKPSEVCYGVKGDPDPAGTSYLEEAAEEYVSKTLCDPNDGPSTGLAKGGFIAGAEWQKEQMMKEAVEGRVHLMGFHNAIYSKEPDWTDYLDGFNEGDKVKIIIVKDDKGRND